MYKYDLEKRTEKFSEHIIEFCRSIQKDMIIRSMISQLVRSATSVGANYCEANAASSRKDFKNKIHICKKEAQETCSWLRLIAKSDDNSTEKAKLLEGEAQQFVLIFGKIIPSLSKES